MNVEKILQNGYFDCIKIDGSIHPVYKSLGTELTAEKSFRDALEESNEAYKHGTALLKIQIVGEQSTNMTFSYLESIKSDLAKWGVKQLYGSDKLNRYLVASADILILKGDMALPYNIKANGKTEKDIEHLASTNDMLEVMIYALELAKYITMECGCAPDYANVAIIDKVYVSELFRRCGISTWLHNNIADIINMYSLTFPTGLILTTGDFANESKSKFNMTNVEYNKMLVNHYKALGYKDISKLKLNITETNTILYKILL